MALYGHGNFNITASSVSFERQLDLSFSHEYVNFVGWSTVDILVNALYLFKTGI